MRELCDAGRTVLVETSGAADVSAVDPRVHKIMDLKAPGSGEEGRNRWSNLLSITPRDEIKFVLADRRDYDWMKDTITRHGLVRRTPNLLASAVFGGLDTRELVRWILDDALPVRVQLQMHKYIWGKDAVGV
jgi:7-carboxy-7-deazaguanine synthase